MAEEALFDTELHERIAARLDLREANKDAVKSIVLAQVRHYDIDRLPRPFEGVADVATGVGKTYIMAATMEYLASSEGVRNFAVITPGRTILTKTIANFSEGNPKSLLPAMSFRPVVITSDTFASPAARRAMEDDQTVKVYIFTVQALARPSTRLGRRTHAFQEGLGDAFYRRLQEMDDLVVFADEHHVYYGPAFSRTVRDLDPYALLGLTATPHRNTPEEQIVFRYPLAAAIADQIVKTPVLVGRSDDRNDARTKLQDGIKLLEMKQRAIERYAATAGVPPVTPIMLVIAQSIAEADEISAIVEGSAFAGGVYQGQVLTVHSDAPDEALAALDRLEEPANPYRIVISVGMLKEGWDVKNVYVIASLRASVSTILTEQTLGRGMRLPFGVYTGIELLDTLEVLGHERYEELLRKANVLNEQFVDWRTRSELRRNQHGELVPVQERLDIAAPIIDAVLPAPGSVPAPRAVLSACNGHASGVAIRSMDEAVTAGESAIVQLDLQLVPRDGVPMIRIPYLKMSRIDSSFSLADIVDLEPVQQAGRRIAADPSGQLRRVAISARRRVGPDGRTRIDMVTAPAVDAIVSPAVTLPLFEAREQLLSYLLHSPIVPARANQQRPAEQIIDAFMDGLGSEAEAVLSAAMDRVAAELIRIVNAEHARYTSQPSYSEVVEVERFTAVRRRRERASDDRYGVFERNAGYAFSKSLYAQDWFDSTPERDVANILDQAAEVASWVRLQRGDLKILWHNAQEYHPDFVVVEEAGPHWVVEVKADRDRRNEEVQAKRRAARRWANYVNADPKTGAAWDYLLVYEADVVGARGSWQALKAAGI
ncbi:MAG: DEAD/DEAH box helicase family protein [Thermomicrobiales bacterium]